MKATDTIAQDPGRRANFRSRYGDWAVVTGASDGIGQAFACELAALGMNLLLVARRQNVLDSLASGLTRQHGIACQVIAMDLAARDNVDRLISATRSLDVGLLVAAAGFGTSGRFIESPIDNELDMLAVNAQATTMLAHHFGGRFVRQRRGGIILMSSVVAFQGVPRAAHYAATKAYVQTLAEGLRIELAPHGVAVVASAPGPVASGFAERANMRLGAALPASVIARQSLRALHRGGTVRPGWLSKLLGWSLAMLPRPGRTRVMTLVMRGMTQHQEMPTRKAPEARP